MIQVDLYMEHCAGFYLIELVMKFIENQQQLPWINILYINLENLYPRKELIISKIDKITDRSNL